ncbi:MAG: thioredoxin domain-containing protein, partial [Myxococcota bacterium]
MDNLPTGYRVANGEHQNGPWKNRLVGASSPYLRQHADNPIDWRTWGGDAFAEAERRQVLIFLSVGYAACHWCHVMAHESFSDPRVARLLNERFVSIKVDREEHPDVDAFCMDTLLEMNGEAGWPATVFLTPERLPVQGGTYYPPYPRYGMPAFRDVLSSVESAWRRDPERVRKRARSRFDEMGQVDAVGGDDDDIITRGHDTILKTVDEERGGWGGGARFP